MGAPAPAEGGVDGPGRAGGKLHPDAAGGCRFAGGTQHGLAAYKFRDWATRPGDRGAVRILLAEPAAGHIQFASGASARWQRGDHAVYERAPGAAVSGLSAREQVSEMVARQGGTDIAVTFRLKSPRSLCAFETIA